MFCYDKMLVNVAAYVDPGWVFYSSPVHHARTHARTQTPNQELHMRSHLPRFYQNDTLKYGIFIISIIHNFS